MTQRRPILSGLGLVISWIGTFACGLAQEGTGNVEFVSPGSSATLTQGSGSSTVFGASGSSASGTLSGGSGLDASAAANGDAESGNGGESGALSSGSSSSGSQPGDAGDAASGACGADDPNLPSEPTIPPACATLTASQAVAAGTLPSESSLDTATIQSALAGCAPADPSTPISVRLATGSGNNAFVSGPLTLPSGVTLWVDEGVTLFASRDPTQYGPLCLNGGNCEPLVTAAGTNSGVAGAGTIDGLGGEPVLGQQGSSWWDLNGSGIEGTPTLIQTTGATDFTLYQLTLQNSPREHVKLDGNGFVVWGITIKTPSAAMNSQGTALSPSNASDTSGITPGESASDGFIVCSDISTGSDQIALKGGVSVTGITIAHNHFLAGTGMSIGSETEGGVSNVSVYDLSIDGTGSGMQTAASGIFIKSNSSVGGLVTDVTYSDVCVREVTNPINLTTYFSDDTGASIPLYTGITVSDFHFLASSDVAPIVTLYGYDSMHLLGVTFDNVIVDGIDASNVTAVNANVVLGPGNVNFTPSGSDVTVTNDIAGTSQPNPCAGKWVTF